MNIDDIDDQFVLRHRPRKNPLDPRRAYATAWEEEPDEFGALVPTSVVFLTNRECRFRCLMCDLWKNTLDDVVPRGAIAHQIRVALSELPPARHIKLYNAGSFFDPEQIPPDDDEEIASAVEGFDRVIVESHPAFLGGKYADRFRRFQSLIRGKLEVAIGLEAANLNVLRLLNKRMMLEGFQRAADFLHRHDAALRVFVLLSPPFVVIRRHAVQIACESIAFAEDCGATVCSVIPTRGGNGAMEVLDKSFVPPTLRELEAVIEYGLGARPPRTNPFGVVERMRVFADLWDIERFFDCDCSPARAHRLRMMNREQRVPEPVACTCIR